MKFDFLNDMRKGDKLTLLEALHAAKTNPVFGFTGSIGLGMSIQRTIEILRDMGHAAPRWTLAGALRAAAAANPPASPLPEQRILAREPDLEDRLAALEPLEPTTFVAVRKAAMRR